MQFIIDAFETLVAGIASIYGESVAIKNFIFFLLGIWTFHLTPYKILGFFATRKFKPAKKQHKYAIVIAARNEQTVIGNLLDSIANQDYPRELVTVFVVADNCTDETARIAREHGAICYERFNQSERTKGFALQFLFKQIERDYGTKSFEGYFVFDADNLLNSDYITRMNEAFDSGEKIITSYRNTKNFDENWLASTYAIHWLRSIRFRHRARSVLRLATNIQGTGFLFDNIFVENGWNYTSLTEDRAFTADAVAHGYPISYNDAAVFYDEQPTNLKIALRQRLRWSKGHLMAFAETGGFLFLNIFVGNYFKDKKKKEPMSFKRFVEGVRCRWASFDTLAQLFPSNVVKLVLWLIVSVFICACVKYTYGLETSYLLRGNNGLSQFLQFLTPTDFPVSAEPGITAAMLSIFLAVFWNALGKINYHFKAMLTAAYVFIVERKRIIKIPFYKKILYCLTWPACDAIGRWTTYFALFMKVEWKPIPHTSTVTIDDVEKATEEKNNAKV